MSLSPQREVLSSLGIVVDGCSAGTHPLVIRFMKGVFTLSPPLPKYTETWDVHLVLRVLKAMFPLHTFTLKGFTFKLVMLMKLSQAPGVPTFHLLVILAFT